MRLRALMVVLGLMLGMIMGVAGPASATAVSYYLPYTAGTTAVLTQGPGGSVSHTGTNAYAYDFDLNGGAVRASAPGTIVGKVANQTGQTGSGNSGNYVVLKHADNTCTSYAHMAHGSITTKAVGASVAQAEHIGNEGNTGYTLPVGGGHHLHFQRDNCSWNSTPVGFVENNWTSQNDGVVIPSDTDGDGTPDSSDACPNQAGPSSLNGCPDSDGDGVTNPNDWCPQVSGISHNYGCPQQNPQNMTADFNEDSRDDVAAFFNYGDGNTAIFTWSGRADGKFDEPVKRWQIASGWDATRLILVGAGDFDGDTNQDIASFFNYGDGALGLFVWYGNGDGSFASPSRIWFTASGWLGARVVPAGTADFNQDGRTDVAVFFNYGGGNTAIFTWNGRADRSIDVPVKRWQVASGWETTRLTVGVTGDFNGDGKQDITAFFNYGGGALGAFVWNGSGDGNFALPVSSWFTASGWDGARIIPAGASDFNNDGRSDITAFFDYGDGNAALFNWSGRTDGKFDAPDKKWQATSGWDAGRITPFGSADFNGDGSQDVSAFFDYGGSSTGAFLWSGNGSGSFSLLPRSWFATSGWDSTRIIPNR